MRRKEVLFAVIGGVVGAVLTLAAGSFSPIGAQNEVGNAEFDTITCRALKVESPKGAAFGYAEIAPNEHGYVDITCNSLTCESDLVVDNMMGRTELFGGYVNIFHHYDGVAEGLLPGAFILLQNKGQESSVSVGVRDGLVVKNKDGKDAVIIRNTKNGGIVAVAGKDGKFKALRQE